MGEYCSWEGGWGERSSHCSFPLFVLKDMELSVIRPRYDTAQAVRRAAQMIASVLVKGIGPDCDAAVSIARIRRIIILIGSSS